MLQIGNSKAKLYIGNTKIKKAYLGATLVYSAGSTVTYVVDTNVSYQEETDEGASCLSPKTFTPAKSGWTFVGWRQDTVASGDILSGLVMGDSPITLYAVYRQTIALSYNGNGSTSGNFSSQTGIRYYNSSGNTVNPTFTLAANGFTRTGYTFTKWALGSAGGTQYAAGASITLSASTTMYAVWTAIAYYAYQNGVAYASMGITNPTIYLSSAGSGSISGLMITTYNSAIGIVAAVSNSAGGSGPNLGAKTPNIPTNGLSTVSVDVLSYFYYDWGGIATPTAQVYGITASGTETLLSNGIIGYNFNGTLNVLAYKYIRVQVGWDCGGGSGGLNKKLFAGIKNIRFY